MEQLTIIMSNLTNIHYDIKAFTMVLEALEEACEEKYEERLKGYLHAFKRFTECFAEELNINIDELDKFLINSKNK